MSDLKSETLRPGQGAEAKAGDRGHRPPMSGRSPTGRSSTARATAAKVFASRSGTGRGDSGLGPGQVAGMRIGEIRKLTIPPHELGLRQARISARHPAGLDARFRRRASSARLAARSPDRARLGNRRRWTGGSRRRRRTRLRPSDAIVDRACARSIARGNARRAASVTRSTSPLRGAWSRRLAEQSAAVPEEAATPRSTGAVPQRAPVATCRSETPAGDRPRPRRHARREHRRRRVERERDAAPSRCPNPTAHPARPPGDRRIFAQPLGPASGVRRTRRRSSRRPARSPPTARRHAPGANTSKSPKALLSSAHMRAATMPNVATHPKSATPPSGRGAIVRCSTARAPIPGQVGRIFVHASATRSTTTTIGSCSPSCDTRIAAVRLPDKSTRCTSNGPARSRDQSAPAEPPAATEGADRHRCPERRCGAASLGRFAVERVGCGACSERPRDSVDWRRSCPRYRHGGRHRRRLRARVRRWVEVSRGDIQSQLPPTRRGSGPSAQRSRCRASTPA